MSIQACIICDYENQFSAVVFQGVAVLQVADEGDLGLECELLEGGGAGQAVGDGQGVGGGSADLVEGGGDAGCNRGAPHLHGRLH